MYALITGIFSVLSWGSLDNAPLSWLPNPIFRHLDQIASLRLQSDLIINILLAGVIYPLIFAGLGGATFYEIRRHLNNTDRGRIHRLDQFFEKVEARTQLVNVVVKIPGEFVSSASAGIGVLIGHLPGFYITYSMFWIAAERFNYEVIFTDIPLPHPVLLLFIAVALITAILQWRYTMGDLNNKNLQSAFVFGVLHGTQIHITIWGLVFAVRAWPATNIAYVLDITWATMFAFIPGGFIQALGAGFAAALIYQKRTSEQVQLLSMREQ
jgi:hypothetical protein